MKVPNSALSTADLAAQTSLKLTEVHRDLIPLQGWVTTCRLDGKLMHLSDARRVIESRLADNERRQVMR